MATRQTVAAGQDAEHRPEAEPPLAIRLFGPPSAVVRGQPLPPLHSRKGNWVLALLALRDAPVERRWLAGTLWPESSEPLALSNLRRTLNDLRHALGDEAYRLRSPTALTLYLDLDAADVDISRFRQALRRGDDDALKSAVSLYRGPLLEGCAEEWVLAEREGRHQDYLRALETLAASALERGDPAAARDYLRRAIAGEPLRESAHRALMEALAASGARAAALEVYRDLRLLLHREVNSEPDPETRAVYDRLRASSPRQRVAQESAAGRGPDLDRLPAPLTQLIGRDEETDRVRACLRESRLVTLTGAGGVGKTRLGIEAARQIAEEGLFRICFVELSFISDPRLVASTLAAAAGVEDAPEEALAEAIAGRLRAEPMLLALDNCEHLLDGVVPLVDLLLRRCPELHVLVTSRQSLSLPGETIWRVPSLEESDAVRLFEERVQQARPDRAPAPARAEETVAQICRRLDGVPLAIELAAACARTLPIHEIAARLDDAFRLLTRGNRALPRQQTLRATLDWSYQLLTEPERRLLARLSIFAGPWTLEAAEAVCSDEREAADGGEPGGLPDGAAPGGQVERSDVLELLSSLVDKSMASGAAAERAAPAVDPARGGAAPSPASFRLLETVRQYAAARLRESGDEGALGRRHYRYFLRLAEAATRPDGEPRVEVLDRLMENLPNLRAALGWSEEHDAEDGVRLAMALDQLWIWRNRLAEGCDWLARLLARAGSLPVETRIAALCCAANYTGRRCDMAMASELYGQALGLTGGAGDSRPRAAVLFAMGILCLNRGQNRDAIPLLSESVDLHTALGQHSEAIRSRTLLARAYRLVGEAPRARMLVEESLALARLHADWRAAEQALDHLGEMALEQGDREAARRAVQERLAVTRAAGAHEFTTHALCDLAVLDWDEDDTHSARCHFEEALDVARDLGSYCLQTLCLNHLARLAHAEGDLNGMRALAAESLQLARTAQVADRISAALRLFGALAVARSSPERGARLLGAAEKLQESIGPLSMPREVELLTHSLAEGHAALGAAAFGTARASGRDMSLEEIVAYGLATR